MGKGTLRLGLVRHTTININVQYHLIDVSCFVQFLVIISKTQSFLVKYFLRYIHIFPISLIRNFSQSKKNRAKYYRSITSVFMQSACYFCAILTKLVPLRQSSSKNFPYAILRKFSQQKQTLFMQMNGLTDRQTDRRAEAKSLFYLLYESK